MIETHHNHFLFSDHYLTHLAPEHAEWQAADAEPTLSKLAAIWDCFTPRAGHPAHTESEWVRPVLRILGQTVDVQPLDCILHAGNPPNAIAVLDIRGWNQRLDQPTPRQMDASILGRNLTPAFQIHARMQRTGLPWGILTNGRHWRLYHRHASGKLDVYYEVDLPALIEQGSRGAEEQGGTGEGEGEKWSRIDPVEAFRYFYLFFRRDAFVGEPSWLDQVLAGSRAHKQGVSQHLKEQTSEALRSLAQGFLDFPGNGLTPTPDTLKAVHDNGLIVLYWMLFILYAESRGQLPINQNLAYTESYSLHALTRRIADDISRHKPAVPSMDELWSYLRRLWHVLRAGNPDLGVPAHHGGLFDLRRYPFLERHRIGDSYLRQAIDLLARVKDPITDQRTSVDYRDLDIRHLGSIYEGLLEYHVEVTVPSDKRLEIRDQRLSAGSDEPSQFSVSNLQSPISNTQYQISLVADRSERKSTGSYYTPDHIVQWLVEHTLGPVLDDVRKRHTEPQADGTDRITTSKQALVEGILGVKVLDPAMGSGHFLVEAVDFIAWYLVSLGLGPMADLEDESELTYWRRRAVQSCIYGVDVNPLAVELAKLSLWPMTAAPGKPLSFLEHRLRCGDSLIGVRTADLHLDDSSPSPHDTTHKGQVPRADQLSMLDDEAFVRSMQSATSFMEQIQALGSETPDHVRRADHLYHDRLRAVTQRYRALADIWTARHFGLQVGSVLWSRLIPHVLHDDLETSPYSEIIQRARDIAARWRFFHWELEFPEVFFTPAPGFDAIMGNPPYLFGEHIPIDLKPFLSEHYELAVGQYDAYWLFYERSFWLLKQQGRHGFIVPDALLARDEVEVLRARLLEDHRIVAIAPVGQAFFDPSIGAALVVWERSPPNDHALDVWRHRHGSWARIRSLPLVGLADTPGRRLWIGLERTSLSLIQRLMTDCRPLRTFARVSRGEEAGRRHLRPIEMQRTDDTPILIGSDIAPLSSLAPAHCISRRQVVKERSIYRPGKIVMVKTGRDIVCTIDEAGYVTLQSVYNLNPHPTCRLRIEYLAALLSSSLLSWFLRATVTGYKKVFPQLNQSNVEGLPIRPIEYTTPANTRVTLLEKGKRLHSICMDRREQARVISFVKHQLSKEPERADVVHDLLAWLAEQTIELNRRRRELQDRINVFEHFDRDTSFVRFSDAFADEIEKRSPVQTSEVSETSEVFLDRVHHDIDGLRLWPAGEERALSNGVGWELQARLKKRNPGDGWRSWQYAEEGNRIAREWVPACRLALSDDKAQFYQFAFEFLDQFSNARSFPSGHRRTTWQKLHASRVPAFDPDVDLTSLVKQRQQLADLENRIARTFELINQIVYRLYGLTDAEIATIESVRRTWN
ncbi:MAG: Eco57I restriction-modification methylase domain-containing protein [Anaerolineae bacterium]